MKTLLTFFVIALAAAAGFVEVKKRPELVHHFYGVNHGQQ